MCYIFRRFRSRLCFELNTLQGLRALKTDKPVNFCDCRSIGRILRRLHRPVQTDARSEIYSLETSAVPSSRMADTTTQLRGAVVQDGTRYHTRFSRTRKRGAYK